MAYNDSSLGHLVVARLRFAGKMHIAHERAGFVTF